MTLPCGHGIDYYRNGRAQSRNTHFHNFTAFVRAALTCMCEHVDTSCFLFVVSLDRTYEHHASELRCCEVVLVRAGSVQKRQTPSLKPCSLRVCVFLGCFAAFLLSTPTPGWVNPELPPPLKTGLQHFKQVMCSWWTGDL